MITVFKDLEKRRKDILKEYLGNDLPYLLDEFLFVKDWEKELDRVKDSVEYIDRYYIHAVVKDLDYRAIILDWDDYFSTRTYYLVRSIAREGHKKLLFSILLYDFEYYYLSLTELSMSGNLELLKQLLERGNNELDKVRVGQTGEIPKFWLSHILLEAVEHDHYDIVVFIVEKGAGRLWKAYIRACILGYKRIENYLKNTKEVRDLIAKRRRLGYDC